MTGISSAETPAHVLSDSQLGAMPYVVLGLVPLALVLWGPQSLFTQLCWWQKAKPPHRRAERSYVLCAAVFPDPINQTCSASIRKQTTTG